MRVFIRSWAAIAVLGAAAACSPAAPQSSVVSAPGITPSAGPVVTSLPSAVPVEPTPSPASATPDGPTLAPPTTAAGAITTFTLVMEDGPKAGTWAVTYSGEVAGCRYLPDLDRWIATWLGPPPLTFIDVSGDDDPYFLFAFDGDSPDATRFRPMGDVTFEVDDRGETATLSFVSEENEADFDDGSPSVTTGPAELTIECGSIFRG
jgi:hypothetical protein